MCALTSEHIFLIIPFNCRFCNDIFVFAKSITSPPSPNILNFLPNPFKKLLQQIHPTNHKLLHKLIRLFKLILQLPVPLSKHLILIPQLYHLLLQIIVAIDSSQKFLLKPFCLLRFNLCLLCLPFCGVRYHHPLVDLFLSCLNFFPYIGR